MALQPGNIETLAKLMQARKEEGEEPFVLVLGAGASLSSGSPGMDEIIARIQEASGRDRRALSKEEIKTEFYRLLDNLTADERYHLFKDLFEKARPSVGYLKLAELAKESYFKYILTTNYDWLLEDAFREARMTVNRGYAVFVVEKDEESQILRQLRFPRPSVKVLKLHGDLSARIFKFTPKEIFEFPKKLEKTITDLLSRDFIIVGHSMRDPDLDRCIRREGGAIWYVNPESPSDSYIRQTMEVRESWYINKQFGRFDDFFIKLHSFVLGIPPEERRIREAIVPEAKERLEWEEKELIETYRRLLNDRIVRFKTLQQGMVTLSPEERQKALEQERKEIRRLLDALAQHGYIITPELDIT